MGAQPGFDKISILQSVWTVKKAVRGGDSAAIFRKLRSACVEVGTIDKYSACVEEDLIRVVEDLGRYCGSTDTIAKLKTKIEESSTFESDPDFVKTLIQNCIDERVSRETEREVTLEKQKIELAKLRVSTS
ncbi:hypothetical protein TNCV_594611 [Trichonephila clavipes]|nr:hypothetical protein TNCV_594611 [Trichonephila clavipes]